MSKPISTAWPSGLKATLRGIGGGTAYTLDFAPNVIAPYFEIDPADANLTLTPAGTNLRLATKSEGWKWWFFGDEISGRGPFRWLVYTPDSEELLATSASFDLPYSAREDLTIEVFLFE